MASSAEVRKYVGTHTHARSAPRALAWMTKKGRRRRTSRPCLHGSPLCGELKPDHACKHAHTHARCVGAHRVLLSRLSGRQEAPRALQTAVHKTRVRGVLSPARAPSPHPPPHPSPPQTTAGQALSDAAFAGDIPRIDVLLASGTPVDSRDNVRCCCCVSSRGGEVGREEHCNRVGAPPCISPSLPPRSGRLHRVAPLLRHWQHESD